MIRTSASSNLTGDQQEDFHKPRVNHDDLWYREMTNASTPFETRRPSRPSPPNSCDSTSMQDVSDSSNLAKKQMETWRSAFSRPQTSDDFGRRVTSSPSVQALSLDDSSNFVKTLMETCRLVNFKRHYSGSLKRRVSLESVDSGISSITSAEAALSLENILDDLSERFSEEMNATEQDLEGIQGAPWSRYIVPQATLVGMSTPTDGINTSLVTHPVNTNQPHKTYGLYEDPRKSQISGNPLNPLQALHVGIAQGGSNPSRLLVTAVRRLCDLLSEPRTHHLDCVFVRILNNASKEMEIAARRTPCKRKRNPKGEHSTSFKRQMVNANESGPDSESDLSYASRRSLSFGCHPVQLKNGDIGRHIADLTALKDFQYDDGHQQRDEHKIDSESFIALENTVENFRSIFSS